MAPPVLEHMANKTLKDHPDLIADDMVFDTPKGVIEGKANVVAKLT